MVFTRRQSRMVSSNQLTSNDLPSIPTSPIKEQAVTTPTKPMPGSFDVSPKAERASPFTFLAAVTQRTPKTPKDRTLIKPTGFEMHPQLHHKSTSTPYDEARWLGFFKMGSQTAPAKPNIAITDSTTAHTYLTTSSPAPIKTGQIAKPLDTMVTAATSPTPVKMSDIQKLEDAAVPEFEFTFKRRQSLELSEEAKQLMAESRGEAAKIRAQMIAAMPSVAESDLSRKNGFSGRKFATAKGKVGRYSDIHTAAFNKMDSIANHPSAWRVDPNRLPPTALSLRRSPSKSELDKPGPNVLKRSPSKVQLLNPAGLKSLKRSPSKAELDAPVSSTPILLRSPPKAHSNNPFVTRQFSKPVRLEEDRSTTSPAKRLKRDTVDDAATTRPQSCNDEVERTPSRTPMTKIAQRLPSSLPKPLSRAMTPTKASLARIQLARTQVARSQSVKNLRTVASMIPSLTRSKSVKNLYTPTALKPAVLKISTPNVVKSTSIDAASTKAPEALPTVKALDLLKSPSRADLFPAIKSILRTPQRLYSDEPAKIAAGTHVATPPNYKTTLPGLPAKVPVNKHVNFTSSTKEHDEEGVTPVDASPVTYPSLPTVYGSDVCTTNSHADTSATFTFRSDKTMSFVSPKISTIRPVRSSDAGLLSLSFTDLAQSSSSSKKRKLDPVGEEFEEDEDKENFDEGDARGAKKARKASQLAPALPRKNVKKSQLPTSRGLGGNRTNGMSAARLRLLATPKRR